MINVGDGTIAIAAGDCGILALEIQTTDGAYIMAGTDTVELTVREKPNADSPVVLHVVGAPGVAQIVLHQQDTDIAPGQYSGSIHLTHGECRYRIWPPLEMAKVKCWDSTKNWRNFTVCAEVKNDG